MDKEIREFFTLMSESGGLIEYLEPEFDFGVDPYDPVIDDVIELINEVGDAKKALESEKYSIILMRGLKRHVTPEIRFGLFETLSALQDQISPADSELLRAALMGLEDATIHPGMIGVAMELYHRQLLKLLLVRAKPIEPVSDEVTALLKKLKQFLSKADLHQLLQHDHEQVVHAIVAELENDSISDQAFNNLGKTLLKIPNHLSARVISDILYDFEMEIETVIRQADRRLLDLLSTRFLYEISKSEVDFFKKWRAYEFLTKRRDYRVLHYLRQELEIKEADQEEDAKVAFYSEVVEMLCDFGDRRAIPTLIDFLYDGSNRGFSESILNEAHSVIKRYPWQNEIISGVNLMREGEIVIIRKGEEFLDSTETRLQNFANVHALLNRELEDSSLTESLKHQQDRWNQAYHEDLDGLRPIDIPVPQVKTRLMHQMLEDFESVHSQSPFSTEDVRSHYAEFQSRWLIKPNSQGAIPLVMIMKAEEKKAKTQALKEHFMKHREETLNDYYIEAASDFEEGRIEECRLKLNAILQIDPKNAFARRLKNQLPAKS